MDIMIDVIRMIPVIPIWANPLAGKILIPVSAQYRYVTDHTDINNVGIIPVYR